MAGMSKFKRLMAMMMAVIMAFTMIPAEAFAHTDGNDADVIQDEYDAEWENEEAQYDGPVAELWPCNPDGEVIGSYNSLQDAFTAAEDQDQFVIVKLLQDVTLTGDHTVNQDINLFLNGHELNIPEGISLTGATGNPVRYPEIHVWSGFSTGTGGYFVSKGILNAYIEISTSDVSISIEGGSADTIMLFEGSISVTDGTVNHLQTWGTAEISGGTFGLFGPEDGISTVTGGTIVDFDVMNNMGSPVVDIKGNVSIERCLLGYYGGNGAGTAEVTISGTPAIGALGFDVDTNNEGIWGSLTITGGYFGNNPYEIVNAREDIKAHIETDIPEPEAYTNQADWAVDHTVYGYRIVDANPSADYVVKVDFRYMDGTMPDPTYKTIKYETIEDALKAIEGADYKDECPGFQGYYHPLLTLLKDVTIDKVITHTLNLELGQIFVEMNGHKLTITDNGGLTGTGILMFEGTKTGKLINSGTLALSGSEGGNIFIFKGCDFTVTGGTVNTNTKITRGNVNISGGEFTGKLELMNTDPDKCLDVTISGSAKMKNISYQVNKNLSSISLNLIGGYYAQNPESFKTYNNKDQSGYVNYDETKLEQYSNQTDWEADTATYTYRIKREVSASSYSKVPAAATGLVENGSAQALVTAGTAVGGTIKYAIGTDATTAPTGGWSTTIPAATAAGTYYVWYRLDPDADHTGIAAACITVSIAEKSSEDPNTDPQNDPEDNKEEETPTPTPVPVDNSNDSPFSPVPEITATTESLYLVKGQSFALNETGWTTPDKKTVAVSKKGVVSAKKATGSAPVILSKKTDTAEKKLKIYVAAPSVTKKNTMNAGESFTVTLTTDFKDKLPIFWFSSATDVATVDQNGKVTAVTKGSATITAQINGKAYNCKITVKEAAVLAERTLHINTGKTTLSLKGVKKPVYSTLSANITIKGSKVTAENPGTAVVNVKDKDGKEYKINLIIEDPTITSLTAGKADKYTTELQAGKTKAITFKAYDREVIFKSSKPKVAYVNEKGEIVALGKGKTKLTAKINGKTVTIMVKVNG